MKKKTDFKTKSECVERNGNTESRLMGVIGIICNWKKLGARKNTKLAINCDRVKLRPIVRSSKDICIGINRDGEEIRANRERCRRS